MSESAPVDFAAPDVVKKRKRKDKLREPEDYKVIFLNDDYTPMDFVVAVLCTIFHKTQGEAERIMLAVHEHGRGVAGVYSFDIARSKVNETMSAAGKYNYPLECILEKA